MASASMAISRSQFWPNNFLRKGVMLFDLPKISGLLAGSEKDYTQVAVFAKLRPRCKERGGAGPKGESRNFPGKCQTVWRLHCSCPLNQMIDIIASGSGTCHFF